ncbi:hypothetical protein U1Q18_038486 [Sarracenia purpurea var. burkii]
MIRPVAVGDGDISGTFDGVYDAVSAFIHGKMIEPNLLGPKNVDAIAVADGSEADVVDGVSDHAAVGDDDVVDVNVVNDDVLHELDRDSGAVSNVDLCPAPVDRLVALHYQLLL